MNRIPPRSSSTDHRPAKRTRFVLTTFITSGLAIFSAASQAEAATYYLDPATGSITNPGTAASPWSTLEAVFTAGKTFVAGDVLLLRNGYHGAPNVKGVNSAHVTIQPEHGHVPKLRKLTVSNASRWVISELDISPLHAGATSYDTGNHVDIQGSSNYITLKGCTVRSAPSVVGWTDVQWPARTGTGIALSAHHSTLLDNWVENIKWGISVGRSATDSTISFNTVKEFANDGLRGLANNCTFEYNNVLNCYGIDDNHDDGFQSWSGGHDGIPVGAETVSNVVLRGNSFISHTDPDQPYKATMQGIGLFDGMYANFVIENNIVITDQWHGIALFGGTNCRVVNNTVLENPINYTSNVPWITVVAHKNGTPSTGCIVRNNLAATMKVATSVGTVDHNIASRSYATYFKNYAGFDFTLSATSPAIGAGISTSAPALDLGQLPRTATYDAGAHEYQTPGGPVASGTYKIISKYSGKALEVQNGGTANNSNVDQWTYRKRAHQKWVLVHLGSSQYQIKSVLSGRALNVLAASTADGANIDILDWQNLASQKWTLATAAAGFYSARALHSGKALDVSGVSALDGANVHQWTYKSGNNQQWSFAAP